MEMYEHQDPFKLTDFITMSYFLNQFLYKAVLTNLFGKFVIILNHSKSQEKKIKRILESTQGKYDIHMCTFWILQT